MADVVTWTLVVFNGGFLWIGVLIGYLIGHIRGSQWGLDHVRRLIRGRSEDGQKNVYIRPPGLTQSEQHAWIRAIYEVDREATSRQLLGLETFCCVECEREPTYELLCGLCEADNNMTRRT